MAGAARLNTVAYGGVTVGSGTSYDLTDFHVIEQDYERLTLSFQVVVRADTETALEVLTSALEAAYRTPNGDLTVSNNGVNFVATTQAGDTGMNARPSIEMLTSHRTNVSRAYACSVTVMLPADESSKGYRRSSNVTITTTEGIRILHVQAIYTAGAGTSAGSNATTNFPTYLGTLETALTGTWDTSDSIAVTHDDENKEATATATRVELIFDQSTSGTDDAKLSNTNYTVHVFRENAQTGKDAAPLRTVMVEFNTKVRKSQTQDLADIITNTLKPYIATLVADATLLESVSGLTFLGESITVNPTLNEISGSITYVAQVSSLVDVSTRVSETYISGSTPIPLADGNPYSRVMHEGPASLKRTVAIESLEVGRSPSRHRAIVRRERGRAERLGFILRVITTEGEDQEIGALNLRRQITYMELEFMNLKGEEKKKKAKKDPEAAFGRGGLA